MRLLWGGRIMWIIKYCLTDGDCRQQQRGTDVRLRVLLLGGRPYVNCFALLANNVTIVDHRTAHMHACLWVSFLQNARVKRVGWLWPLTIRESPSVVLRCAMFTCNVDLVGCFIITHWRIRSLETNGVIEGWWRSEGGRRWPGFSWLFLAFASTAGTPSCCKWATATNYIRG